ncbi:MAG: DUF805 domain-containing protein [Clostridia bacterium]|nr:DUF805 domain-containing protein [Clostridia bacterium]
MIKIYIDAIKKWRRWDGRARRKEYWLYQLCNILVGSLAYAVSLTLRALEVNTLAIFSFIATYAYLFLQIIPTIAISVRRLHDSGRSGGLYFVSWIPYIGSVWFFVLMLLPGTKGRNKFGPDPRDAQFSQEFATSYGDYPDFRGE